MIIRLAVYFGLGALAHWLWIGPHVDPSDIFTYACLLLGPIMCLVWVFKSMVWVFVALAILAFAIGVIALFADDIDAWNKRKARERERLRVINEAKRRGNL